MPTHDRTSRARQRELQQAQTKAQRRIRRLVRACFELDQGLSLVRIDMRPTEDLDVDIQVTAAFTAWRADPSPVVEALRRALCLDWQRESLLWFDFKRPSSFTRQDLYPPRTHAVSR